MSTATAAFATEEERWCRYLAHGAQLAGQVIPGMTINPILSSCKIGLIIGTIANAHAAVAYPNPFAATGALNPTWEPTATALGQYEGYTWLSVNRYTTVWTVEQSGGHWQFKNTNALTFPTAGGGSTGCTITGASFCIPDKADTNLRYPILLASLDTPYVLAAGATPAFQAGELVFIMR